MSVRNGSPGTRGGQATTHHSRPMTRSHRFGSIGWSDMTWSWLSWYWRPATVRAATAGCRRRCRCPGPARRACGTSARDLRTRRRRSPVADSSAGTCSPGPRSARVGGRPADAARRVVRTPRRSRRRARCGRVAKIRPGRTWPRRPDPGSPRRGRRVVERQVGQPTVREPQALVSVRLSADGPPRGLVLGPPDGPERLARGREPLADVAALAEAWRGSSTNLNVGSSACRPTVPPIPYASSSVCATTQTNVRSLGMPHTVPERKDRSSTSAGDEPVAGSGRSRRCLVTTVAVEYVSDDPGRALEGERVDRYRGRQCFDTPNSSGSRGNCSGRPRARRLAALVGDGGHERA